MVSEISFKDVVGVNVTTVGKELMNLHSLLYVFRMFHFHSLPMIRLCGGCAPMSLVHLLMYHLNLVLNSKARFPIHPPIVSS